jgi:histone deacetylase 11
MSQFIYHQYYNVRFAGLEKFHPFDSCKYEKIFKHLETLGAKFITPSEEVSTDTLLTIHTKKYLKKLTYSSEIARLCEMPFLWIVPNMFLQSYILSPMRWQVAGTILAGEVALQKGWAVNLGGGMHHASSNSGGGWCLYTDIPLSIKNLFNQGKISNAMIIDLDVHQGNGIERDIFNGYLPTDKIFMIDAFNPGIYPCDNKVKKVIDIKIHVNERTTDELYLENIQQALDDSFKSFIPNIVFYNAGTDILEGDPLNGGVSISAEGVIARDKMVMSFFIRKKIPIVMVLSGGYSSESVKVICDSMENLYKTILRR